MDPIKAAQEARANVVTTEAVSPLTPKQAVGVTVTPKAGTPAKQVKIELTHQINKSGTHRLILQSQGHPATFSPEVDYTQVAMCVDPATGTKYYAVTKYYDGVFSDSVFSVNKCDFTEQRV